MTRPLRVGDRVTATGTVTNLNDIDDGQVCIHWDNASDEWNEDVSTLTWIPRAEPPVGSVVAKDGVAWVRRAISLTPWWTLDNRWADWDAISDGEILFTPEAPDVG